MGEQKAKGRPWWMFLLYGAIGLTGMLVLLFIGIISLGYSMVNDKKYEVFVKPVKLRYDARTLAKGKHLAGVLGCDHCHGKDMGGILHKKLGALGNMYTPNITPGKGSVVNNYTVADWVRAIRHGIRPDGTSVKIMPSGDWYHMSDEDVAALIAYMKRVKPVDRPSRHVEISTFGRFLVAVGAAPLMTAAAIDHQAKRKATPKVALNARYGKHLATLAGCVSCHKADMSGGFIKGLPPDFPPASNLTKGSEAGKWTQQQFLKTLVSCVRPDGNKLHDIMPCKMYKRFQKDELKAIWLYTQSLPSRKKNWKK